MEKCNGVVCPDVRLKYIAHVGQLITPLMEAQYGIVVSALLTECRGQQFWSLLILDTESCSISVVAFFDASSGPPDDGKKNALASGVETILIKGTKRVHLFLIPRIVRGTMGDCGSFVCRAIIQFLCRRSDDQRPIDELFMD